MAKQQIPESDTAIENVDPNGWSKGKCPPEWVPPWVDAESWVDNEEWKG